MQSEVIAPKHLDCHSVALNFGAESGLIELKSPQLFFEHLEHNTWATLVS
jgi:hypothetical protein